MKRDEQMRFPDLRPRTPMRRVGVVVERDPDNGRHVSTPLKVYTGRRKALTLCR